MRNVEANIVHQRKRAAKNGNKGVFRNQFFGDEVHLLMAKKVSGRLKALEKKHKIGE